MPSPIDTHQLIGESTIYSSVVFVLFCLKFLLRFHIHNHIRFPNSFHITDYTLEYIFLIYASILSHLKAWMEKWKWLALWPQRWIHMLCRRNQQKDHMDSLPKGIGMRSSGVIVCTFIEQNPNHWNARKRSLKREMFVFQT